jgi:hypothetical protein
MTSFQLTKSDYSAGVQCSKRLYNLVHHPEWGAPPDADLKLRFEQGREVGELARERFNGGALIGATGSALPKALAATNSLVKALRVPAIFEAAFKFESFVVRVDILKNNYDGSWDLIEVKATTEVKPEHLEDLAFQFWVLKSLGVNIQKAFLSHINNEVFFPKLDDFFLDVDLTEAVTLHQPQVELKARALLKSLDKAEAPAQKIGRQCANPYACEFKARCWKDVPKGSVLELYNYRKRKPTKFELFHEGPKLIEDLTNEIELTRFQQIQFLASTSEDPIIDHSGLAECLGKVRYPIYYFDFETIAPAIPILEGMRPYQRIPVQFSCDIQKGPGGVLEHVEFLASGEKGVDPRRECIDAIKEVFRSPGTVIAYHDDFERSLIRELAAQFLEESDFLLELEKDFWDLEDAFQNHFYHRSFGGSVSIKKVLPYFAPEMKYEKLAIKNGGQAQAALVKLLTWGLTADERKKLREDLLTYCAQDSMAMVVIHQKLIELVGKNIRYLRWG